MFIKHFSRSLSLATALSLVLLLGTNVSADDDCFEFCTEEKGGLIHAGGQEDQDYICCLPGPPPTQENRKCRLGDDDDADPAGAYQCSKHMIRVGDNDAHSAVCWTENDDAVKTRDCGEKEYRGALRECFCAINGICLCFPVPGPDGVVPQGEAKTMICLDCF
jgi:hypothetical protein